MDIITFGSPCTDMSVAGRRAGLEGQQSVLFYQAIRIIAEYKMWGNGVALPCVVFVLSGIVYCTQSEIPFSKIDEVGAGMYKGGKITRAERHAIK